MAKTFFDQHTFDNLKKVENDGVTLTEEYYSKVDELIRGICLKKAKYAESVGLDFDTIYQECWVKIMGGIRWQIDNGTIDENSFNPKLMAQCCYNLIIDLGRYNCRRGNQIPVDPEVFNRVDTDAYERESDSSVMEDVFWNRNLKPGTDFDSALNIQDIENLFPEDSRERRYVEAVEIYSGVKEVEPDVFDSIFTMTSNMRNELAWYLGFAGSGSSGFRNLEYRVRQKIRRYIEA